MRSHKRVGVYAIKRVGAPADRCYVGSSVDIDGRWYTHRKLLSRSCHHSSRLQSAWAKYGAAAFELVVLEECAREQLDGREQAYLDTIRPAYNVALFVASPMKGRHPSAMARARMSAAQAGKPKPSRSEEHKQRNRVAIAAFYAALSQEERRERMRPCFEKRAEKVVFAAAQSRRWAGTDIVTRRALMATMHAAQRRLHPVKSIRSPIVRHSTSRASRVMWASMREAVDALRYLAPDITDRVHLRSVYRRKEPGDGAGNCSN